MVRNTAREIAVHLAYELSFTDKTAAELVEERLTKEYFETLCDEDEIYREVPGGKQSEYIRSVVEGDDIPNSVAINEAVDLAKKYETPETVRFINGILGSFVRSEITSE